MQLFRIPPAGNSNGAEGFDGAFAEVRFASERDFDLARRHASIKSKRVCLTKSGTMSRGTTSVITSGISQRRREGAKGAGRIDDLRFRGGW